MNDERRKRVNECKVVIENALNDLRAIADEETEAFEAMPESLQSGENGVAMEEIAQSITDCADNIESEIDNIDPRAIPKGM